jgi:carboxymethylenebutenolidase
MDRVYIIQLVRSFQVGEMDRRTFLKRAAVALGSLAAANMLLTACQQLPAQAPIPAANELQPATAAEEPIEGLTTSLIEYPDRDGETLIGYLARSSNGEPNPAIIVIQEWWGLEAHIKDVANRFAGEGFVALAPDLYHGVIATEPNEATKLVMELDQPEAVAEIQQAIAFLQEQDFVAGSKVGIVGFCMGGGLVLQTALQEEDLFAGVVFYGSPLAAEEAGQVKTPILGLFGSADGGIPTTAIEVMHTAFTDAGIENEYEIYDGAQHAFFNDTRSSYNSEAAANAWSRTLDWFRAHANE